MTVTIGLYEIAFWAAVVFITIGALLGLMGVWIDDFWKNDVAPKLLMTDFILAGSSIAIAVLARLLG